MQKPILDQIISLEIHGLGSSGEGVGYFHGFTVFVEGALPQERIEAQIKEVHARYAKAKLISINQASPHRVEPPCPLFGVCGGCQLMHLSYEEQLVLKRQRVIDAFQRIGRMQDISILPCIASPKTLFYRNKIQSPVRHGVNGVEIGLYQKNTHDLVEVEKCYIHSALGQEVYEKVRSIIKDSKLVPYDPKTLKGNLRHILIKTGIKTKEVLVILVTSKEIDSTLREVSKKIKNAHPKVRGVVHNLNKQGGNTILSDHYSVLEGNGFIEEEILDLRFKISPASFFQVNPEQAENLYAKALEFADLEGNEVVLDAFCGVGTLSLFFAKKAKKVIGVECVKRAIEDAIENAKINQIENVSFFCKEAEKFIDSAPLFDLALLNPPRKGCDLQFLKKLAIKRPKKIVYISCDPATLARDLCLLQEIGYSVLKVQPFDMFPETSHVECVALLKQIGLYT